VPFKPSRISQFLIPLICVGIFEEKISKVKCYADENGSRVTLTYICLVHAQTCSLSYAIPNAFGTFYAWSNQPFQHFSYWSVVGFWFALCVPEVLDITRK
jgi:hypothetical protein